MHFILTKSGGGGTMKFMRKAVFSVIILTFCSIYSLFARVPDWYEHKDAVYPSDFYITAIGEGKTKEEAEIKAIALISIYLQTTTDICNSLIKNYNECEKDDIYNLYKTTSINEKSIITSNAEFFGVQFAQGFFTDGLYATLAFIDREGAFAVYEQRIKNNSSIIKSLLLIAEDYNNPIYGYEAAKLALSLADMNVQLLKMARLVKNVVGNYFDEDNNLIERVYTAYEINKKNRIFYISVSNDYQGMIYRTVSNLLESYGYNISKVNGICKIPVEISVTKEKTDIAVFLYCGIVVNMTTDAGDVIFSYSRNFGKKGGKTEDTAYKRAFLEIENELKSTFIDEFSSKIKVNQ